MTSTEGGRPNNGEELHRALNERQREAAEAPDGPVLVIAGPGSGKTRVIVTRIWYLITTGRARPREIGAITFTRKAADEMAGRLERMLPPHVSRQVWISTFHRLCGSLLRRHGGAAGVRPDFRIADEAQQMAVMRQSMFDAGIDIRVTKPQTMVQRMSVRKNRMQDPTDPASWPNDPNARRNAGLCQAYQSELARSNRLDFDDMLLHAVRSLRNSPEAREDAAGRLKAVLVDEWQDTNLPQYLLVRLIADRHRNVFVVGDPDQAIYGWRGAELRNILDFEQDFPDCRRIDLDVAYRAPAQLLAGARAMIRSNRERIEHQLKASRAGGNRTAVLEPADPMTEADCAVERASVRIRKDKGTVAVLYRTNAQSRAFETGFKRAGIPYRITGGKSFYDRPEVQDALSVLQVAIHAGEDDEAMRRFIELAPHRRIGKQGISRIEEAEGETFVIRAVNAAASGLLPDWQARSLHQRFHLLDRIRPAVRTVPLETALETVLEETGYLPALEASGDPDGAERAENVWELVFDARVFRDDWGEESDDGPESRLEVAREFLKHCDNMRTPNEATDADILVTLSTLHRAKGLEFDTVFIGGFDADHLPNRRAVSEGERSAEQVVEEERRLAYVGMTRARTELVLSAPRTTGSGGRQRPTQPSAFLDDIPPDLLTEAVQTADGAPEPAAGDRKDKADGGSPESGIVMGPYGPEIGLGP